MVLVITPIGSHVLLNCNFLLPNAKGLHFPRRGYCSDVKKEKVSR